MQKDRQPSSINLSDSKSAKHYFELKPLLQSETIPTDIPEDSLLAMSVVECANILKDLFQAQTVSTYIVDSVENEISLIPRTNSSSFELKIEPYQTMPGHAAFSKTIITSDMVKIDKNFPQEARLVVSSKSFCICVPIKTPDDNVVAVYEIIIRKLSSTFDNLDLQALIAITNWIGVAVLQSSCRKWLERQEELNDYLLQITNNHHFDLDSTDKSMSDLLVFAREIIGAEQCSLYIINEETDDCFYLEEYQQGLENPQIIFKKHLKKLVLKDNSDLSNLLTKKQTVISNSNDTDTLSESGINIKSILCVPIFDNVKVIGAIQLINKRGEASFDKFDEFELQQVANYYPIIINHIKSYLKMKEQEIKSKVMEELLVHFIRPCVHDEELVRNRLHSLENKVSLPNDFFTFSWYPSPDDTPNLIELTIKMFHKVLGDSFMALNNVPKFVLTTKNCYRSNPYHNYLHAFCVTHTMANIIRRNYTIFSGIERKSLMVATLCHDVDHRGYTNNFIQLNKHYLSKLYDSSPLENHHFAVAKLIIQQCGMFSYIQPEIYNELLVEIYDCIIATDLSLYFQCRMELMKVADEKTFTFKNTSHRKLIKGLMMTACDLSGQTKPMEINKTITEDVYEEFFMQGDMEKKMGFVPLPTMDKDNRDMLPQNQVQFLSVVVLPCVEAVCSIFENISPMVSDGRTLLMQWKQISEQKHSSAGQR